MTAVRKSIIWAIQDQYGKGNGTGDKHPWRHVPPGFFFSHSHNRSTNRVDATGTRNYDFIAYGKVSGTFDASFNIDYDYPQFLKLIFTAGEGAIDGVTQNSSNRIGGKKIQDASKAPDGSYEYTLYISDFSRCPSFVIRQVILNRQYGGPADQITQVRGCVINQIRFSMSAGSSQWAVSIAGFTTRDVTWLGKLDALDYKAPAGHVAQFSCLFNSDTPGKDSYVANCDSLQFSVKNNTEAVYTTCSPYAQNFYEGKNNYEFTTAVWSINPRQFKQRLYTGGRDVGETDPGAVKTTGLDSNFTYLTAPLCKDLAPMPEMTFATFSACSNDSGITSSDDKISKAIAVSKYRFQVSLTDLVIKSMSWQRGDQGPIMDQLSSVECRTAVIKMILPRDTLQNDGDSTKSDDYGNRAKATGDVRYDADTGKWLTNGSWQANGTWLETTDEATDEDSDEDSDEATS